ncbi:MAG: HEAT repeat domain-containing protein [Elusimicrobia bacterium]|nr:HEAT repeat domain-containing protein [Elusimicrobiota bacterium]
MRALLLCAVLTAPALAQTPQPAADAFMFEADPLVITAPRLKLKPAAILDPSINATLLQLLRQRQNARPDSQAVLDASVGNLNKLSTATGYKLKTRYTELGFLLTEGLAGVTDMSLASELETTARSGTNVQTRAAALVALAYTRNPRYQSLFQQALLDANMTVRLGALEALSILGAPGVQFQLANASRQDASLPVQVYATAGWWRTGDVFGREALLRLAENQDWLIRAMAVRYLGEMGGPDEYRKLLRWLSTETHQAVRAELCSALLNLQRYAGQ